MGPWQIQLHWDGLWISVGSLVCQEMCAFSYRPVPLPTDPQQRPSRKLWEEAPHRGGLAGRAADLQAGQSQGTPSLLWPYIFRGLRVCSSYPSLFRERLLGLSYSDSPPQKAQALES